MLEQMIIAGSGGQGIQFLGQLFMRTAVDQGLNATYLPTYGAERRGGFSFCSLVLADTQIYAPVFKISDTLLAFDQRAWDEYADKVQQKGLIIINSDLIKSKEIGVKVLALPATSLALEIKNERVINLIMLGAYLSFKSTLQLDKIKITLEKLKFKSLEQQQANLSALLKGYEFMQTEVSNDS